MGFVGVTIASNSVSLLKSCGKVEMGDGLLLPSITFVLKIKLALN